MYAVARSIGATARLHKFVGLSRDQPYQDRHRRPHSVVDVISQPLYSILFPLKAIMSSLQFAPWSSDIELAFYSALASLKINHDKLDDSARKVLGLYEVRPSDPPQRSCRMQIHGNALTTDESVSSETLN